MQPQPAIFQPLETGGIFASPPAAAIIDMKRLFNFPFWSHHSHDPHKHSMYTKKSSSTYTGKGRYMQRVLHLAPAPPSTPSLMSRMTRTRLRAIQHRAGWKDAARPCGLRLSVNPSATRTTRPVDQISIGSFVSLWKYFQQTSSCLPTSCCTAAEDSYQIAI